MQIGGNVSVLHNQMPKAALAIAAFGLLLLAYAAFNSGNRIEVKNGSYVGGNVTGSKIDVTPSK
jgi:hypothetical protein